MNSESNPPAGLYDLLAWLEKNKTKVIVAAAAVVALGFFVFIYSWQADRERLRANTALLQLRALPSQDREGASPEAFLKVADEHGGSDVAGRARLLAAGALFGGGEYAEAESAFKEVLEENQGRPWAPQAAFGQAAALEAQGKNDEAFTAYQNVLNEYPNQGVALQAKMALARIHEARGEPKAALGLYDQLAETANGGRTTSSAIARREELLSEHPELAPTNAAPAAEMTAPSPLSLDMGVEAVDPSEGSGVKIEVLPEPAPEE